MYNGVVQSLSRYVGLYNHKDEGLYPYKCDLRYL